MSLYGMRYGYHNKYIRLDEYIERYINQNIKFTMLPMLYDIQIEVKNFVINIILGYKYDDEGNEVLAFTKKIVNSNYIYDAIPKDFDVLKVFLWDNAKNPIMKVYYPTLCRR